MSHGDHLSSEEIWSILVGHMDAGRWYDLQQLYGIVVMTVGLRSGDLEPDAPGSSSPGWQRNVRNVLQRRKGSDDIEWSGQGRYRLRST